MTNSNLIIFTLVVAAFACLANIEQTDAYLCLNGGTPITGVNACTCNKGYFGSRCQAVQSCGSVTNSFEPTYCLAYANYCLFSTISKNCPHTCKCKVCPGRTAATKPTCMNGGVWNDYFCTCLCSESYTGSMCELKDCVKDPDSCATMSKSVCSGDSRYKCPNLCGMCQAGLAQSTPAGQTPTPLPTLAPTSAPPMSAMSAMSASAMMSAMGSGSGSAMMSAMESGSGSAMMSASASGSGSAMMSASASESGSGSGSGDSGSASGSGSGDSGSASGSESGSGSASASAMQ